MFENDYEVQIISTYKHEDKPAFEFSDKIKIVYLLDDHPYRISIKKLVQEHKYSRVINEILRRIKLKYAAFYSNKKIVQNLETDHIITTRIYHNKIVNKYLKNPNIIKIATEHNYHNNDQRYIRKLVNSTTNYDYFIHCTDELYNFYKNLIKGPKNVKIYHSVDVSNNLKSSLNNDNIISVGRLSEEKGFLDLIEVMKIVRTLNPQIKLTICGDGHQRELIEDKIKEYDLTEQVIMKGFLGGNNLAEVFKESSLYVMTSKTESFGLVLLEAMHYGLPCIVFDSASGARQILKDDVGILVGNRDTTQMASQICNLLRDRESLKSYSLKSLEKVKNYTLDKIYCEWKRILQ